jgi:uncharacterized membrane-anchored protein YhcB (DUF1043 family)
MTGIEQVLVFVVGILVGAVIMQFRQVQNTRDSLQLLAGQFDQLQGIMHGYVRDTRAEFEKQLDAIEAKYEK